MYKIEEIPLTLGEELLVAVMYLNVEKFKYLVSRNAFKVEYLTVSTPDFEDSFSLASLTIAYHYICQLDEYKQFKAKNDKMIEAWRECLGVDLDLENGLRYVHKHGPDYGGNVEQFADLENHLDLIHDLMVWRKQGEHLGGEEEYPYAKNLDYIVKLAMIVRMKNLVDSKGYHKDIDLKGLLDEREKRENLRIESFSQTGYVPKEVKEFLLKHDKPGEILALYDEDKSLYYIMPSGLTGGIIRFIVNELKHLSVRVGGNSYRIGNSMKDYSQRYNQEHRIQDIDEYVRSHTFEWGEPIVEYADKYDFRGLEYDEMSYSMVWFYVNNVTCGFYNEDGTFVRFNSNVKGAWQIAEVIKAKGYNELPPATCALTCGRDERISGKQETMCKEEGIDFFNMYDVRYHGRPEND